MTWHSSDSSWLAHEQNEWNSLLSPSASVPGEPKVFGLSAGLLHSLCRLGQRDGKRLFIHIVISQMSWPIRTIADLCISHQQITNELGRCGPVAKAVLSVETILCSQLVDSMVIILHRYRWKFFSQLWGFTLEQICLKVPCYLRDQISVCMTRLQQQWRYGNFQGYYINFGCLLPTINKGSRSKCKKTKQKKYFEL